MFKVDTFQEATFTKHSIMPVTLRILLEGSEDHKIITILEKKTDCNYITCIEGVVSQLVPA